MVYDDEHQPPSFFFPPPSPMPDCKSTKYHIPHRDEPETSLVGVLEQWNPEQPTTGRKIALILHGAMGHKDYLFLKTLAHRLPMDSFRFDFRGNHETGGPFKQGRLYDDVADIEVAVDFLKDNFGYKVDLVVGHSRGSTAAMHWVCRSEEGRGISAMVNASGRYRMHRIYGKDGVFASLYLPTDILPTDQMPTWKPEIDVKGYYEWKVNVARKPVVGRIDLPSLEDFCSFDTSIVWDEFPPHVDVLTIHGTADKMVPVYDAMIFTRALSPRSPGTHNLHIIEDTDHNYTGLKNEVVDVIMEWWTQQQTGKLQAGMWRAGVRSHL